MPTAAGRNPARLLPLEDGRGIYVRKNVFRIMGRFAGPIYALLVVISCALVVALLFSTV